MKQRKVEAMGRLLKRATEELERRDLSELPAKQLVEMVTSLQARLDAELREVRYRTGEMGDHSPLDALLESITTERKINLCE